MSSQERGLDRTPRGLYPAAMHTRSAMLAALFALSCACGGGRETEDPAPGGDDTTGDDLAPPPSAERPTMTAAECEASGGSVVGDIGDGATHRPDYRCPDGQPPSGNVAVGIEGSVCCPAVECPTGGVPPQPGPDGPPENCQVLFEGCCYADANRACEVAGCGVPCAIMESYPGQLRRCD